MTAVTPPIFIHQEAHPAATWRQALEGLLTLPGIVAPGHLAVTQRGAGANMTVDVAEGRVFVPGTESAYQGVYLCETQGVTNVGPLSASDPTNPRRDLIVARVKDSNYSGALRTFGLEVVTGTAAASPADPAVPANSWVLARVTVAAAASSILNAAIADARTGLLGPPAAFTAQAGQACGIGGVAVAQSATLLPTVNLYEGLLCWVKDIDALAVYLGSSWLYLAGGPWTACAFSNNWTNYDAPAAGFAQPEYRRVGDIVYLRGSIKRSTGTPSGGETILTVPAGFRPPEDLVFGVNEAGGATTRSRLDMHSNGTLTWVTGTAGNAATHLPLNDIYWSVS